MNIKLPILIFYLLLQSAVAYAAHLVGGEISYECLGNNQYRIKLVVYRDCASLGAPFDAPATISIYNGSTLFANLSVFFGQRNGLPVTAPNSCTTLPPFVCTEKAVYTSTITLPPSPLGYTIAHQRCCRNASISNLPNPGAVGNTFTVDVPPNDTACNSTPDFLTDPPVALCLNIPVDIDMSTQETDGDSVVYTLCNLLTGGGPGNGSNGGPTPAPNPAAPPPYATIPFSNGFSASNPILSNPPFTLNPQTGILSGLPTQVGQYVFAICANEYRNGVLLSTVRRDFQFNVTAACRTTRAVISGQDIDSSTLCTGERVTFKQTSIGATSWFWDFGEPFTNADTSVLPNPTYTYADTGLYTVTLIANPGDICADTSYSLYRIFEPVTVSFDFEEEPCFDEHILNFQVNGSFSDSATIRWDFGGTTTIGDSSNLEEPQGVRYLQPGVYVVSIAVQDFECFASYSDTVRLYPGINLKQEVSLIEGCLPVNVSFTDNSTFYGTVNHFWDFGDGDFSTAQSPKHTYTEPGVYSITHRIIQNEGCPDIADTVFINQITVYPIPNAGINVFPPVVDIYNPNITLQDSSSGAVSSQTFLPNGEIIDNLTLEQLTLNDTGIYTFTHIVFNQFGCSDTTESSIYVEQPVNFFIPNAFTPNGDGKNDVYSFVATGVQSLDFKVFNRWGEIVFSTNSTQAAWNGLDRRKGTAAPPGVYTYVLVARVGSTGTDEMRTGTIKLIR